VDDVSFLALFGQQRRGVHGDDRQAMFNGSQMHMHIDLLNYYRRRRLFSSNAPTLCRHLLPDIPRSCSHRHMQIHMHMHTLACTSTHTYAYTYTYACTYTNIHIRTLACTCTNTHTHTLANTHTCTCKYTHKCPHKHTHTYPHVF